MSPRDGIFIVPDFRDRQWCDRIRAAMERGESTPAEVHVNGFVVDRQVRRTLEVDVDSTTAEEVERSIASVCTRVARFFGIPLSGDEGPGFLRYLAGGFYRRHCDVLSDSDEEFPRRVSVVMFLTSAGEQCEGGALRIYQPEAFDIAPKAGTLVAFPSDVPHEVLPVTAGVRDVVVDWFF
jgi:predicted 2-oxoglutarate/Fe(II)-dependent dioxygenase YbiX